MASRSLVKRIIFYVVGATALISLFIGAALIFFAEKPPAQLIESARKAIAGARQDEAGLYAPDILAQAEALWDEAMADWRMNNEKNVVVRDYSITIEKSALAVEKAQEAREKALETKAGFHQELQEKLKIMRVNAAFVASLTMRLPVNHGIRKKLSPLMLRLDEMESAFNRGDLLSARENLAPTQQAIASLRQQTHDVLRDYFSSHPEWKRFHEEMKQWSLRNKSVALVVDKFSRKCLVYRNGKVIREYEVELGINWLGDKMLRGDRATPEGKYTITVRKSGSQTIYHKALLINYPNAEDKQSFAQQKARGIIPRNANIGGAIEIHGGGGRGIDWTDGCVALENKDMDQLYALCPVGTPVAIVGSLLTLDEFLEQSQSKERL